MATAHADEGDAFYAAMALERDGKPAQAAAAHEALVARAPQDPFADDALAEAARLYEEKLGEPARAADAYERVLRDYPDSRVAVRASRRAQLLREGLGEDNQGAAAVSAWNDILNGFPTRTRPQSMALAEALLAAHPDFSQAPRVRHWIGEQQVLLGAHEPALATFRDVQTRWPGSEWARRARRSEADELTALGRYDDAERGYASLHDPNGSGPYVKELGEAIARLHVVRLHARLATGAWLALALLLAGVLVLLRRDAGSFAGVGRALVRPPIEALFLLPIAALVAAAGQPENENIARASLWLAGAMIVIAWLSGASLNAGRARGRVSLGRTLVQGGSGAAAMLAASYLIVYRLDLLDFLIHTVRFGVD